MPGSTSSSGRARAATRAASESTTVATRSARSRISSIDGTKIGQHEPGAQRIEPRRGAGVDHVGEVAEDERRQHRGQPDHRGPAGASVTSSDPASEPASGAGTRPRDRGDGRHRRHQHEHAEGDGRTAGRAAGQHPLPDRGEAVGGVVPERLVGLPARPEHLARAPAVPEQQGSGGQPGRHAEPGRGDDAVAPGSIAGATPPAPPSRRAPPPARRSGWRRPPRPGRRLPAAGRPVAGRERRTARGASAGRTARTIGSLHTFTSTTTSGCARTAIATASPRSHRLRSRRQARVATTTTMAPATAAFTSRPASIADEPVTVATAASRKREQRRPRRRAGLEPVADLPVVADALGDGGVRDGVGREARTPDGGRPPHQRDREHRAEPDGHALGPGHRRSTHGGVIGGAEPEVHCGITSAASGRS